MDKRLIGGVGGINNLKPAKYEWAWKMVNDSIDNSWFHHNTPMTSEKDQYETKLTPVENEIFLNVFAKLTTSDVVIMRNIASTIMRHITAPEVQLYLGRQIAEEATHSITYQHVIEVLCLDEASIYTRYLTIKEMANAFDYAKLQADKIDAFSSLESFLEGLFFYYMMFEGVWFYNGFSPIFSMGRRNIMPGTNTQLQYILRDETTHVTFGIRLLRGIFKETNFKPSQESIHKIVKESIDLETRYAHKIIQPILGYNADFHIDQAQYIANRRLKQLGYSELYPDAKNALPWLDEMAIMNKEKNFFETHVTEYRSAASLDGTW